MNYLNPMGMGGMQPMNSFAQQPVPAYQPTFQPQRQMYTAPQYGQAFSSGITWVQGIEGAKAFQLPPNSNAQLMDSENDGIFYLKTCDGAGMCNLRTFRFEEITAEKNALQQPDMSQYVTRDELKELLDGMNANKGVKINGKPTVSPANDATSGNG